MGESISRNQGRFYSFTQLITAQMSSWRETVTRLLAQGDFNADWASQVLNRWPSQAQATSWPHDFWCMVYIPFDDFGMRWFLVCKSSFTDTVKYQLLARAFISQNGVRPQALKREQAAICNRLLFVFAPTSARQLFDYNSFPACFFFAKVTVNISKIVQTNNIAPCTKTRDQQAINNLPGIKQLHHPFEQCWLFHYSVTCTNVPPGNSTHTPCEAAIELYW